MIQFVINNNLGDALKSQLASKEEELLKIFEFYAGEVVVYFLSVQGSAPKESKGAYWTNHTFKAVKAFFAEAYKRDNELVLNMEFNKRIASYVEFLEEGHSGRFASLPSLVAKIAPLIIRDVKLLYGDES